MYFKNVKKIINQKNGKIQRKTQNSKKKKKEEENRKNLKLIYKFQPFDFEISCSKY